MKTDWEKGNLLYGFLFRLKVEQVCWARVLGKRGN